MRAKTTLTSMLLLAATGLVPSMAYAQKGRPAAAQVANVGYNEAHKAMQGRNFAEAARLFYMVATQSSGDIRAKAEFGLAEALRNLGYLHSASYFYMRLAVQGPQNPFFRLAMEQLASINATSPLGRASVASLFGGKSNIEPVTVPPNARGFYFFYKGLEAYERENVAGAKAEFLRVPENSPYYTRAQYYLGVMSALTKDLDGAVRAFRMALKSANRDSFRQLSVLALARIHYERKEIRQAFEYYSQIPRDSDLWLQSLFEGAWAFFLIQKHNNTLGNIHTIHSPFFQHRFFPEAYVLEAITYLKLCYFQKVDLALAGFAQRYKATFQDLNNLLKKYQGQPNALFNLNMQYRQSGDLREFPAASEIIDSTSRSDAFKEAVQVVKAIDREERAIARSHAGRWENTGLMEVLRNTFEQRKAATLRRSGEDLFAQAVQSFRYLKDLSDQTKLINYERATSQTDQLRSKFNAEPLQVDNNLWGEGMKPLNLNQQLEYWPFEGEWWEDELGGYVYNVGSKCGSGDPKASKK